MQEKDVRFLDAGSGLDLHKQFHIGDATRLPAVASEQ